MSDVLSRVTRVVAERTGMRIGPAQREWVSAAVERLVRDDGRPITEHNVEALLADERFVERLIDQITVRETFVLREHEQLASLDWPAMLRRARAAGRSHVRVWSAGCASGEEPYTLAMLASDALGPEPAVSVLGTDIAGAALARARDGCYEGRTVRRLAGGKLLRHFRQHAGRLCVDPAIAGLVRFHGHNLVNDPSPPMGEDGFDLVVCRNVLIHLDPAAAARAGESLAAALQPQGTLLLAPADRLCLTSPALQALVRGDERRARRGDPGGTRRWTRSPDRRPSRTASGAAAATTRFEGTGEPPRGSARELAEAVRLADAGRLEAALEVTHQLTRADPMDASAHVMTGVLELASASPESAVAALRRALYLDPGLAIAAFHLGRAREASGDRAGAEQAYEQALHSLDPEDRRHDWLVDQFSLADVAEACKLRLLELRQG